MIDDVQEILVHSTCTVVYFTNGVYVCSHPVDDYDNYNSISMAPNLRATSNLDLNECLVAYWVDKHHKQWFFTNQDEKFLQDAATMFPDRIYFILVPANI